MSRGRARRRPAPGGGGGTRGLGLIPHGRSGHAPYALDGALATGSVPEVLAGGDHAVVAADDDEVVLAAAALLDLESCCHGTSSVRRRAPRALMRGALPGRRASQSAGCGERAVKIR